MKAPYFKYYGPLRDLPAAALAAAEAARKAASVRADQVFPIAAAALLLAAAYTR